MGFENKYPYTDFHEMNLDWILEVVKRVETEWPEFKTTMETEWNTYKDGLTGEGGEWPTFKTQVETIVNNFIHDVVGNYNGNLDYKPGMFCSYEGNVYKCTTGSSAAYPRPFSAYGWFSYAGQNTNSIVNDLFNYLTDTLNGYDNEIYSWIQHTAEQWDETKPYVAGDYCSAYVGGYMTPSSWRYYKCIQDCTGVNLFDTHYWKQVIFATDVAETIAAYKQAMQNQYDQFLADYQRTFGVVQVRGSSTTDVMSQKAVSDELQTHDDMIDNLIKDIAPVYDSTKAYKIGNLLTYLGKQYECIKDATAGTLPTNTTYFKEVSVAEVVGDLQTGLENGTIVPNKSRATESIENVSDESGTTQDNPFISQGTGTNNNVDSVDTSPVAKQLEKQGNTVVKNQLVSPTPNAVLGVTVTANGNKYTLSGTGTSSGGRLIGQALQFTIKSGHKYLCLFSKTPTASWHLSKYSDNSSYKIISPSQVFESNYTGAMVLGFNVTENTVYDESYEFTIWDITTYPASVITDLTSNPYHFSWYYNGSLAYDAGSLKNASGRYLVCTKRNLLNPNAIVSNKRIVSDGTFVDDSAYSVTDYILIIPNKPVYFRNVSNNANRISCAFYDKDKNFVSTYGIYVSGGADPVSGYTNAPANAQYVVGCIPNAYKNDSDISLYYSAEQGGEGYDQYYPYQEPSVYDTGTEELLAFDTKDPDGTWHKNTVELDLSAIVWDADTYASLGIIRTSLSALGIKDTVICSNSTYNIVNSDVITVSDMSANDLRQTAGYIYIKMSGTPSGKVQYKLATPTTETADPYTEVQVCSPYGTEQFVDAGVAAGTRDVSIPCGHETEYAKDIVGAIEGIPFPPSANGNYKLMVSVASGVPTYSWVSE